MIVYDNMTRPELETYCKEMQAQLDRNNREIRNFRKLERVERTNIIDVEAEANRKFLEWKDNHKQSVANTFRARYRKHEKLVTEIQNKFDKELAEKKTEYESKIQQIRNECDFKIVQNQEECDKRIADIKKKSEEDMNKLIFQVGILKDKLIKLEEQIKVQNAAELVEAARNRENHQHQCSSCSGSDSSSDEDEETKAEQKPQTVRNLGTVRMKQEKKEEGKGTEKNQEKEIEEGELQSSGKGDSDSSSSSSSSCSSSCSSSSSSSENEDDDNDAGEKKKIIRNKRRRNSSTEESSDEEGMKERRNATRATPVKKINLGEVMGKSEMGRKSRPTNANETEGVKQTEEKSGREKRREELPLSLRNGASSSNNSFSGGGTSGVPKRVIKLNGNGGFEHAAAAAASGSGARARAIGRIQAKIQTPAVSLHSVTVEQRQRLRSAQKPRPTSPNYYRKAQPIEQLQPEAGIGAADRLHRRAGTGNRNLHGRLSKCPMLCRCGKRFEKKVDAERHIHAKIRGLWKCEFCKIKCATKQDMNRHRVCQHGQKNHSLHSCDSCKKYFQSGIELTTHYRNNEECKRTRIRVNEGYLSCREPEYDGYTVDLSSSEAEEYSE